MEIITVISILSGIGVLFLTFRVFFSDPGSFHEALRYWFTSDIISLFRGEWGKDFWNESKMSLWLASGVLGGIITFKVLEAIFL